LGRRPSIVRAHVDSGELSTDAKSRVNKAYLWGKSKWEENKKGLGKPIIQQGGKPNGHGTMRA